MKMSRLEHTEVTLMAHEDGECYGTRCTLHNRSDHAMRSFPQHWRGDRGLMERICPHGVGHPDPDDFKVWTDPDGVEAVHGCDGCCNPESDIFKVNEQIRRGFGYEY